MILNKSAVRHINNIPLSDPLSRPAADPNILLPSSTNSSFTYDVPSSMAPYNGPPTSSPTVEFIPPPSSSLKRVHGVENMENRKRIASSSSSRFSLKDSIKEFFGEDVRAHRKCQMVLKKALSGNISYEEAMSQFNILFTGNKAILQKLDALVAAHYKKKASA